jgi:putative endonuclease
MERRKLGNTGEKFAAEYLRSKGYSILASQQRTPFGEIDLVCLDGAEVVFVEVKTRRTQTFGYPEEAVTREKIQHMVRSAEFILSKENNTDQPWRMDVMAIEYNQNSPKVTHIKGIDISYDEW